MDKLKSHQGIAARALEFTILCAARSGEVRGATWSEIDMEKAVWTIPSQRMKAGKESALKNAQAIDLLRVSSA